MSLGDTQAHAFCTPDDADWITFTATAGQTIWVETQAIAPYLTYDLTLYADDGTTELATGRPLSEGQPGLAYTVTQSGTYRLRVRNTSGTGNPAYTYDLRMTTVACSDGYESNDTPAQAHPFTLGDTQTHFWG
jgi:hypothetical protein